MRSITFLTFLAALLGFLPQDEQGPSSVATPDRVHEEHRPNPNMWGDVDGDGLEDLYIVNGLGEDRLFRNQGNGRFADITVEANVGGNTDTRQAFWTDFHLDTRLDLLLLTEAGTVRLYRGGRNGVFEEISEEVGLAPLHGAADAEWVDYDRDGWLDLRVYEANGGVLFFHSIVGKVTMRA